RNTRFARAFADSIGNFRPVPEIEDDTAEGKRARREAGEYLAAHGKAEFDIPGITFGGRYDGSPIIIDDGTAPPCDEANEYVACAKPGGRAPHAWLSHDTSLYDRFGFEWTLLRFSAGEKANGLIEAAAEAGVGLKVLDLPLDGLRDIYGADLVLVRPDQIVAWRSNSAHDPKLILSRVLRLQADSPANVQRGGRKQISRSGGQEAEKPDGDSQGWGGKMSDAGPSDRKQKGETLLNDVDKIAPVLLASGAKREELSTRSPDAVTALRTLGMGNLKHCT